MNEDSTSSGTPAYGARIAYVDPAGFIYWQKLTNTQKEFTLHYGDLDTTLNQAQVGP